MDSRRCHRKAWPWAIANAFNPTVEIRQTSAIKAVEQYAKCLVPIEAIIKANYQSTQRPQRRSTKVRIRKHGIENMKVTIIHCPTWKSYVPKVASYAAEIKEALGIEVAIETGSRGQFDVLVNGQTVVSRKGGLMAMLTRKPWPAEDEVITAIKTAVAD